jgi:anti-sigma B factor antagonist
MCADASRCQGLDTDAASNAAGSTQAGLRLDVSRHGSAAVIAVAGELDLASSALLEAELDRVESRHAGLVILDLRQLGFMDSTGLQLIVDAHRRAQRGGWQFALVHGLAQVQRLLSLTGVDQAITLATTPEELLGEP